MKRWAALSRDYVNLLGADMHEVPDAILPLVEIDQHNRLMADLVGGKFFHLLVQLFELVVTLFWRHGSPPLRDASSDDEVADQSLDLVGAQFRIRLGQAELDGLVDAMGLLFSSD